MFCETWFKTLAPTPKLVTLSISGHFRGLRSTFFDHRRISVPCDPRYTTLAASSKIMISGISGRFRGLRSMVFGVPG